MVLTESNNNLKKGDLAPAFNLVGTDGKNYSISSIGNFKALLVIFICNHCPYVKSKLEDLNKIHKDFKDKGMVVIGINSNDDKDFPEDSFENMRSLVTSGEIDFLYLRDETQEIARKYGAVCTPDPFLFNSDKKLIFHSRIGYPPSTQPNERHELYDAIKEYLDTGKITSIPEKPSMGCSIKWKNL